jgi:two-component system, NtrC family, sensor kinase
VNQADARLSRQPAAPTPESPATSWPDSAGGFRLLWAAALIVPLLIFAAAAAWSWSDIVRETRHRLERTVDMLHEHALRSFETQEAIIEAVNLRIRNLTDAEIAKSGEVQELLEQVIAETHPSDGIMIVSGDDRIVLTSSETTSRVGRSVADRDYVRALRGDHRGTYIGEVEVSPLQNTALFPISRRSSNGRNLIVSLFRPSYFEEFYKSVVETPHDVVALIRVDGRLLARSPRPADVEQYRQRIYDPIFDEVMSTGRAFTFRVSPVDQENRYYAFRQVGSHPILVAYGLDPAVPRRAWIRQLAISGLVCLAAALLLMILTHFAQQSVRRERAALAAARLEAERRADAETRLRHAQRIDALGQIVGGVAHDFNNVVMAVMAGTRAIAKRSDDAQEVRRIVELIDAAADRGGRLTKRMLHFARREDARTELVDIREALDSVTGLLGHTLGAGFRVTLDMPDGLPPAKGDRSEFETVIVNLVVNARDAMPNGGLITISTREEIIAVAGPSHAPGLEPGRFVRVAVSDHGIGMDPDTLARVGEAFFTTKPPGKGTGLGLAMARGFAEHAGGALRIDSEVGRGTTVTIWLAIYARANDTAPEGSA